MKAYSVVVLVPVVASSREDAEQQVQTYFDDMSLPGRVLEPYSIHNEGQSNEEHKYWQDAQTHVCDTCEHEDCKCG